MNMVIINGMHRSGTMLLSRLVNALPGTFIVKDGLRLPWYYFQVEDPAPFIYPNDCYRRRVADFDPSRQVLDISRLRAILLEELPELRFGEKTAGRLKQVIESLEDGWSYRRAFTDVMATLAEQEGCSRVGTKTTHMFRFRDSMLSAFPELKWIDIIRDPRGWYCSARVSHHETLVRGMLLWNRVAWTVARSSGAHPNRTLCLTFDQLIMDGQAVMQRICDFLGVPVVVTDDWLQNLNLTVNDGSPWYPNPSFTKSGQEIQGDQNLRRSTDYRILDPLPACRWRAKLSGKERLWAGLLTAAARMLLERKTDARFPRMKCA